LRTPLIAGNWKMNTTVTEAVRLVKELILDLDKIQRIDKVVCPPFVSLAAVRESLRGSSIQLGAQNLYYEQKGAYTGEISPLMLCDLCRFVILGHSERRMYFGETNELISKKTMAALQNGLQPILCVGEVLAEYEAGETREVVKSQLLSSLAGVKDVGTVTIAYEPVWAIGSGKAATGPQANETIKLIRTSIADKYGHSAAAAVRILYGGSVTAGNIAQFVTQLDIDGALVGGASLKPAEFISIVRQTADVKLNP
jgi:triosephosphate isomerase (TIM)